MRDLLTRITMSLGNEMAKRETNVLNEKYQITKDSKDNIWKLDAINAYIKEYARTMKIKDLVKKCIELSKSLDLDSEFQQESYWKLQIKEFEWASGSSSNKSHSSSSYGCGNSSSYGCGSSRGSSRSYGCGGSSSSYGC